ncbi:MAG TPA: hypothetical protein VNE39_00075 [Planctomycetota bacterium]|nr:hypothetical protein [Planctomycetota bacterium]
MKEWVDPQTRRTVRQLTTLPLGATLGYFRLPRRVPGGLVLAWGRHDGGNVLLLHPDTGEVVPRNILVAEFLRLDEATGRMWFLPEPGREVWAVDLPDGSPELVGEVPQDAPGHLCDISCDGRTVILSQRIQEQPNHRIPTTRDAAAVWRYLSRPRHGRVWVYDLATRRVAELAESIEFCFFHLDASPADPELLKFAKDMLEGLGQRMWTVRVDGSDLRRIRHQEVFEVVTHEFWWPDAEHIGYIYQDRRSDPTLHQSPWCEYAPVPTRLGVADLAGNEVYLSDPLSHYHTHLFASPDGRWVCGEGTDGHSFVHAAPFSWESTRLDLQPLATIHTPYVPFRGQHVEAGFSADARWLLYNDTVDDHFQVCAVKVE